MSPSSYICTSNPTHFRGRSTFLAIYGGGSWHSSPWKSHFPCPGHLETIINRKNTFFYIDIDIQKKIQLTKKSKNIFDRKKKSTKKSDEFFFRFFPRQKWDFRKIDCFRWFFGIFQKSNEKNFEQKIDRRKKYFLGGAEFFWGYQYRCKKYVLSIYDVSRALRALYPLQIGRYIIFSCQKTVKSTKSVQIIGCWLAGISALLHCGVAGSISLKYAP